MRVLVTGGSGFIGSHIVDVLVENGHNVTSIDIKPPRRSDVRHIEASILDRRAIEAAAEGAEAVYHIAGFSNIDFVKADPVGAIELNILSTAYLLDACRKSARPPHFIYASSSYVFDRNGHLYTTSKASSEKIIEDFNSLYGVPFTILRYGTAYGPRNREADAVFLFIKNALEGRPIEIHGSGAQRRNFTHVRDLAEGSVKAMGNRRAVNETLVVAQARGFSIMELADIVREIVNPKVQIKFTSLKRENDYRGVLDYIEESQDILDWKCKIELEAGIRELASELILLDRGARL